MLKSCTQLKSVQGQQFLHSRDMPAFSKFCDTSEKFPVPAHNNIYPQLAPT